MRAESPRAKPALRYKQNFIPASLTHPIINPATPAEGRDRYRPARGVWLRRQSPPVNGPAASGRLRSRVVAEKLPPGYGIASYAVAFAGGGRSGAVGLKVGRADGLSGREPGGPPGENPG